MSKKNKENLYALIMIVLTMFLIIGMSCTMLDNSSSGDGDKEDTVNVIAFKDDCPDKTDTSDRPVIDIGDFRLSWYSTNKNWVSINPKDFGSYIFADMQTLQGQDPAVIRLSSTFSEASVRIQEEQSFDEEVDHAYEEVGIMQVVPDKYGYIRDYDNLIIGKTMSVNMSQSNKDQVHTIYYDKQESSYKDPVVIGTVTTQNGGDPVFVKIHSVDTGKATYSLSEFNYKDGAHVEETLHFIVIEKGAHVIAIVSGVYYVLEAGKTTINAGTPSKSGSGQIIKLLTNFDRQPYIFGALQTNDNSNPPAITRISNVNSTGDYFYAKIQYEEELMANNTANPAEKFGYLAIGRVGSITTHTSNVVENNGWLQVKNARLCNEDGYPVQLEGMSSFWINWNEGKKFANEEVIDWLVRDWKIDVYRIAIGVNPYDGREYIIKTDEYGSLYKEVNNNCGHPCEDQGECYIGHGDTVNERIYNLVDACVERGIYVILDWHVHDALMNQWSAAVFFLGMANRYKNTPNVIFEIWNEPSMQNNNIAAANAAPMYDDYIYNWEDDIKPYCEMIINYIRGTGSNNIIICPSENFDQRLKKVPQAAIKESLRPNVLYSAHFYAGTTEFWSNWVTDSVWSYEVHNPDGSISVYKQIKDLYDTYAYAYNDSNDSECQVPVFVSEWGTSQFDGGQDPGKYVGISESEEYLALLDQHKISWCNWAVTDKYEAASILKPGACAIGFWTSYALSESGTYVRLKIRD